MARKKNGIYFEITAWGGNILFIYLSYREAKALIFFIEQVQFYKDGCIHPYELAHYLWPDKYPKSSTLAIDKFCTIENGVAEAMSVISNIRSVFKDFVEKESLSGIYDPFPFFIMNDPTCDFRAITLSDGIEIKYFLKNNDQTKEEL